MARAKGGKWLYGFDEAKANHICRFAENLPHTKGKWFARGETIKLEPWQIFGLAVIFGWLILATRKRRFRLAYWAIPRKNGKSIIAAVIGLYMFCADGEFGSEVYAGATTEKQAWEVFEPAHHMVDRTPDLKEQFGIVVQASRITIPSNGSKFEPVIGKPGNGASPHCAIVDEYHEHDTDTLFDSMQTGMGARDQPLLLAITTAGDNVFGPCRMLQSDLEKVLEGSVKREDFFGIVYGLDKGDDWTTDASLRKANPNYGVSVGEDYLRSQQQVAIGSARKQGIFKTRHLNEWVGALLAYFNVQRWKELGDPSLSPDEFRGLPCVMGLDLSTKIDITACVLIFKKQIAGKDHFYLFLRAYLPEDRAMDPEHQHYQEWTINKHLLTTPGCRIDYEYFQSKAIEDAKRFKAREICYDPFNAEQLAQNVAKAAAAEAVEIRQNTMMLSDPMKSFEAAIAEGRIHHEGNPVFEVAIGNVVAKEDANENVLPRKERVENFIDPAAAALTGFVRALVMPLRGGSIYNTRGVQML